MSWILVKHYHDSGTIEGVYGPYTQEQADWLRTEIADCGMHAWTVLELRTLPGLPAPERRDPASTTAAVTERGPLPRVAQPGRTFGIAP